MTRCLGLTLRYLVQRRGKKRKMKHRYFGQRFKQNFKAKSGLLSSLGDKYMGGYCTVISSMCINFYNKFKTTSMIHIFKNMFTHTQTH